MASFHFAIIPPGNTSTYYRLRFPESALFQCLWAGFPFSLFDTLMGRFTEKHSHSRFHAPQPQFAHPK